MSFTSHRVRIAIVALALCLPNAALSQSSTEIFDAVNVVTDWFSKLTAKFDTAVKVEGRDQLQRAVDRLRKDLYTLEGDAQVLLDDIPDQAPSTTHRARLDLLAKELQETVQRLTRTSRELGAELRLNEAEQVETALFTGLRTRNLVMRELRSALLPAREADWNGALIRLRMSQGIESIRTAQIAVTSFSRKLAQSK